MIKIPLKYQVFDEPVKLFEKDFERLSACLIGWNRLHELFLLGGLNEPDLKSLVVMEMMGAQRPHIISRLLGRLAKLDRQRYLRRIGAALT